MQVLHDQPLLTAARDLDSRSLMISMIREDQKICHSSGLRTAPEGVGFRTPPYKPLDHGTAMLAEKV